MDALPPPLPPLLPSASRDTLPALAPHRGSRRAATPGSAPTGPSAAGPTQPLVFGPPTSGPLPLSGRALPLHGVGKDSDPREIRKAAQMMEGFFLSMLLKEMDKTIPRTGFLDGGQGEKFFREMMYDQMAEELSAAGGIGLAKLVEDQLLAGRKGLIPNSKLRPQVSPGGSDE